jgi:predicted Rossmann-fold nucleotide-binding protein
MKRLAVYCGSATPDDPIYMESARAVGAALAERGIGSCMAAAGSGSWAPSPTVRSPPGAR